MTEPTAFRLRQLASPGKPTAPGRGGRMVVALLLRLGCVALLAGIGYIHLHLWQEGYRQIPTNERSLMACDRAAVPSIPQGV